jgi:hypothetical protein
MKTMTLIAVTMMMAAVTIPLAAGTPIANVGATAVVTGTAACQPNSCTWAYVGHHGGFATGAGDLYANGVHVDDCKWPDLDNGFIVNCQTSWGSSAPHFFGDYCAFTVDAVTTTITSANHEICVMG